VDLITEVGGPFIAGLLLLIGNMTAFLTVAAINFVSFIPEYQLLRTVYHNNDVLAGKEQQSTKKKDAMSSVIVIKPDSDVLEGDRSKSNDPESDDGVGFVQGDPDVIHATTSRITILTTLLIPIQMIEDHLGPLC